MSIPQKEHSYWGEITYGRDKQWASLQHKKEGGRVVVTVPVCSSDKADEVASALSVR